jgi:hypothetical protein
MKNNNDKIIKQIEEVFSEHFSGINHSKETGFTFEKITENHLYNLGMGSGTVNISVTLDGKESEVIKIHLSDLRGLQARHHRSTVGDSIVFRIEYLIRKLNEK